MSRSNKHKMFRTERVAMLVLAVVLLTVCPLLASRSCSRGTPAPQASLDMLHSLDSAQLAKDSVKNAKKASKSAPDSTNTKTKSKKTKSKKTKSEKTKSKKTKSKKQSPSYSRDHLSEPAE